MSVRAASTGGAASLGALLGVAGAWRIASPLPGAISLYFEQPPAVGLALALGLFATMAAPYTALFALLYRRLAARPGAWLPLLAAAAWTGSELARGRLLTESGFFIGNPWGLLGYTQARCGPLVQIASALGVYGLGFLVAALNAGLAEATLACWQRGRAPRALVAPLAAPALLLLSAWLAGRVILANAPAALPPEAIPVAIVQDNLDAGSRWRSALYGIHLEKQLELTAGALAEGKPAVVFWPESAMTFLVEREPLYRRAIASVLGPARAQLVAGAPRAEGEGTAARFWNSVYLLAPSGEILGRYDKQHLVPFSERFPIRIEGLRTRFGRFREIEPGAESAPLPTAAGRAGIVTCNEALLPEVVSRRIASGATLLVSPAHDRWIADPAYGEMQLDVAILRAVEQRRFLVRASTSGPSAIVDPWGVVQVRSAPLSRAVLRGHVVPRAARTLYARAGDAYALGCLALVVVFALFSPSRRPES